MYPQHPEARFGRYSHRYGGVLDWREGGTSWSQDYPRADRAFCASIAAVDADSCALGGTTTQAKTLREYLLRGGFLMLDDFWGTPEWDRFEETIRLVFPDRQIVEIENQDSIFHHCLRPGRQVSDSGRVALRHGTTYRNDGSVAHWRGIYDDRGRVMVAMSFNSIRISAIHGSGPMSRSIRRSTPRWEFRIGVNYVVYALTH